MFTRRTFLKYTGATTLTLFATGIRGLRRAIAEALPGGTLDPASIPKFVTPLLVPPVMPKAGSHRRARRQRNDATLPDRASAAGAAGDVNRRGARLVVAALAGLASSDAVAEGDFAGHVAATTDYVFRGVSQTRGAPALQADVHYEANGGWFAGLWFSTVDLNPGSGATQEFNVYAGLTRPMATHWDCRLVAVAYVYPNDDPRLSYDYAEVVASIGWLDRVVASIAWSPNTSRYARSYGGIAADEQALSYEIVARWPLVEALSATASAGYYDLSDLFGSGYGYGGAGLSYERAAWQLDLGWYVAADYAEELFGPEVADARWSLTAAWKFR
ncbi:MAG TPA: TorF family putative porin [Steroidobacteraceae bacterium]|nr:TorF family putative porin [Steroidobacteraceae bacterium]